MCVARPTYWFEVLDRVNWIFVQSLIRTGFPLAIEFIAEGFRVGRYVHVGMVEPPEEVLVHLPHVSDVDHFEIVRTAGRLHPPVPIPLFLPW